MSTTIRTYRSGTLVDTEVDADDGAFSVSVDTTGWTPGTYDITVTAQTDGTTESLPSSARQLTINAAGGSDITIDNGGVPWSTSKLNVSGLTLPNSPPLNISTEGAVRTLVAVFSFYPPGTDPYPCTVVWEGGTPAGATDWVLQVWPVGTSGAPTTQFRSYALDPHDGTIHWTSQIWTCTTTSQQTNKGIRVTRSGSSSEQCTGILSVFSLANANGFGAKVQHHTPMSEVNGANQEMQIPITAQADNSLILGVIHWGNLPDGGSFVPMDSGTTIFYQAQDGGADGGAASYRKTGLTAASTPYTLGFNQTTAARYAWTMCAIEVLRA